MKKGLRRNGAKKRILYITIIIVMIVAAACHTANTTKRGNDTGGVIINEEEAEGMEKTDTRSEDLLIKSGGIKSDSAQGTVDTLNELGISDIISVEKLPSERGINLRITDSRGRLFCLGYGKFGYLEIVSKDEPDGEILYAEEE